MHTPSAQTAIADTSARRRAIGFLNFAHALDHFVILIFPTVVIGLEDVYARSYAELIGLSTASFVAFGVFSLPAGWLADRWSRRNMMAVFYFGCGLSLAAAAFAPTLWMLALALFALGVFAAIYHPVGMPMLIDTAVSRGRTLAFNGVCGNLGAALAAGMSALLASYLGWRAAFLVPAAVCVTSGFAFLALVPDDRHRTGTRMATPEVPLLFWIATALFALFVVVSLTAGLTFNTVSVALPKIVDERLGREISLAMVGGLATAVFLCGALAQLAMGRLVERVPPHILFALVVAVQHAGIAWAAYAAGPVLIVALALTMAAIYGQVTVSDIVLARYTADAWRGRVYAVRYFLTFITSGAAVAMIALLHGRGGFDLVIAVTAVIALVLLVAVIGIAVLATFVERERDRAGAPAE